MQREEILLANGTRFKTKESGYDHFRRLWARHKEALNTPISLSQDHSDLFALYQRYTELVLDPKLRRDKSDVSHFTARINARKGQKPTNGFWVHFKDGTSSDFSFIMAVRGKGKSKFEDFRDACRRSVDTDIQIFKERYFTENEDTFGFASSQLSGEPISRHTSHVDHVGKGFDELVREFMRMKEWVDVPSGVVSEPAENQTAAVLIDQTIDQEFKLFHDLSATLRVISDKENLSLAGKARQGKKRSAA